MAPDPKADATAVYELLEKLREHAKLNRRREVVQLADQVLEAAPGDADALRCKVVALIRNHEISEALSALESSGDNLDLKAYCLSRSNRFDEALGILRGLEKNSFVLQLEAQIYYKKQDLDASTACYEALLAAGANEEVKSNTISAFMNAGKLDKLFKLMERFDKAHSSFDLAYNTACAMIAKGELSQAEEHLLLSRKLGQEKLMDDKDYSYTPDEIEDILAPVNVQLAYIQQLQGKKSDAAEAYLSVLARDLLDKDMPSVAVATNNLTAIRRNKEVTDSLKKLEVLLEKDGKQIQFSENLQKQLSASQKEAIVFNYFLLLLTSNKMNQAREVLPSIAEEYGDSNMPYLLKACLFLKEGKPAKADEVLGDYVEKNLAAPAEVLLLSAQARASAGQYLQAADSLQQVEGLKHMPAVVATIVDLKQRAGDSDEAESVLDAAVNWWNNRMDDGTQEGPLERLSQKAAELKLLKKKFEDAAKLYVGLTSSSSESLRMEAFTALVCSYAETDLDKAESFERQLPPIEGLTAVDVDALERTPVTVPADAVIEGGVAAGVVQENAGEKKKRKRKPRYPKGFDPENPGPPPDPERWIPMRERSYYRPRKKDKRAAARGSQGAVGKEVVSNGPSSKPFTASSSSKPETKPPTSSNSRNKKKGRR